VNRAILIVICDFLVSSMLSMMTGMVPAHTGGTGVGLDERTTRLLLGELELRQRELENLRQRLREAAARVGKNPQNDAQVQKLTAQLIQNMRKIEELKRLQRSTEENTGKLTAAQVKEQLEEEVRKRLELEIRMRDQKIDAGAANAQLQLTQKMLKKEQARLAQTEKKLDASLLAERKSSAEIRKISKLQRETEAKLNQMGTKVKLTEKDLAAAKASIAAKDADLAGVKNALREMNARIGQATLERQALQNSLSFTTGKLNTAERDKADYQGQLSQLRRRLSTTELKLNEAVNDRRQMEEVVKRSLNELAEAQKEQAKRKDEAVAAAAKLSEARHVLKQVAKVPPNNAYRCYSESVVRFDFALAEKRLMVQQHVKGSFLLPLVQFGSQTMVVGAFELMTGIPGTALLYQQVTQLSYRCTLPGKKAELPHAGALLGLKNRSGERIGALEVNPAGRTPLKALTSSELSRRGTEGLYLFSSRKFGRESAALGSRCSLDLSQDSPCLVIRNARSGSAELPAEIGDIVISREGEFVGIAAGTEPGGANAKYPDVRVFLFDSESGWDNADRIPIIKAQGDPFYTRFGSAMQSFLRDRKNKSRR